MNAAAAPRVFIIDSHDSADIAVRPDCPTGSKTARAGLALPVPPVLSVEIRHRQFLQITISHRQRVPTPYRIQYEYGNYVICFCDNTKTAHKGGFWKIGGTGRRLSKSVERRLAAEFHAVGLGVGPGPRAVRSRMRRRSSLAATPRMANTISAKSDVVYAPPFDSGLRFADVGV